MPLIWISQTMEQLVWANGEKNKIITFNDGVEKPNGGA